MGFRRLHQLPRPARLEKSVAWEVHERHELLLRRLPPRLVLAEEEGEGGSLDAVAQGRANCVTRTCRHAIMRVSTSLSMNCSVIPPTTSALAVPLE